jgi:hypothetical protein
MNKTTKIILISIGSLALLSGGYLIYRYFKKKRKKSDEDVLQTKLTEITSTPTPTPTPTPTSNNTVVTTNTNVTPVIRNQEIFDKMPIKPVSLITSSTAPTTLVTSTNSNVIEQPNLNSVSYLKLDDKLKKLYNVLGMLSINNGIIVYVADGDFVPSQPNLSPSIGAQKAVWRALYNNYLAVVSGFNNEETNNATKIYGNKMLNLFKTKRLDYLFPPLTANGQMSEFNPNAPWFLKVEKETLHLKTNFWKN